MFRGQSGLQLAFDQSGNVSGIISPRGVIPIGLGAANLLESQFTRALLMAPPPRQINAIKDLSGWGTDGQYLNSAVDADIYDSYAAYTPAAGTKPAGNWLGTGYTNTGGSQTVVGALSAASKALMLHQSSVQWDLNAGDSLLIQHRFFIPDNGTANTINGTTPLFGSCTASMTVQGLYANVTTAGALTIGLRAGAATPANQATSVNAVPLLTNTPYCLTLLIDGVQKTINAWVNGQQLGSQVNIPVTGDTTATPTNYSTINSNNGGSHMGVGCYQTDANAPTGWNPQRLFTSHFRVTVLPGGLSLANPGLVDFLFNRNPDRFMSDALLVGGF